MSRTIPRNPRMRAYTRDDAKRAMQEAFVALFNHDCSAAFLADLPERDVQEHGIRICREARIVFASRHRRNSERLVRINAYIGDPLAVFA